MNGISRILIVVTCVVTLLTVALAEADLRSDNEQVAGVGVTTLYFPFINNGEDLLTTITLVNRSTMAATGTISFFDDTGVPMPMEINGQAPQSVMSFSLPPRGRADFATSAAGQLQTGSARITSSRPIGGISLFGHSLLCPGGIGPSVPVNAFITPVRNLEGTDTLLAITNVDAVPALLQIQLLDEDGILVGTINTSIAANGRIARSISSLFPTAENITGSAIVNAAGGRVAAVAIDINPSTMLFIMLPITPL